MSRRRLRVRPRSLLAAVLLRCSLEEGGIRPLARRIGLSPQTVYNILGGQEPGKHVARALADYLAVRPPDTELCVDTVMTTALNIWSSKGNAGLSFTL